MSDGTLKWIKPGNINEVITALKGAEIVGLDTETTALSPRHGRIRLIQLAIPGTTFVLDCFRFDPLLLSAVFDGNTRLVGHNLGFDLLFLDSVGLVLPHGKKLFDTMVAGQLLDAGLMPQPSHSLEAMAPRYTGETVDKGEQKSDWSGELTTEQLVYAAKDAAVLLPLYKALTSKLKQASLTRTMALEMRALPGMVWLNKSGIRLDEQGWRDLAYKNRALVENLEHVLAVETDSEDMTGYSLINWRSPAQVVETFNKKFVAEGRTVKKKVVHFCGEPRCNNYGTSCHYHGTAGMEKVPYTIENVDNETLGQLAADGDNLAKMLMKYRKSVKARDTYGLTFLDKYLASDGRLYPSWHQIGAATGRMASSNPNGQNIPHSKDFRSLFIPDDGHVFALADYSQIELRICVEMSRDPKGMQAYCIDRSDLHKATAALILGVDLEDRSEAGLARLKEARQVAKSLNFGLIFGAGSETLRLYAMAAFDVILTPARAAELRNAWRELYAGIVAWQKVAGAGPNETRTLGDRRAVAVDNFTSKLNYPVQGTGIDGLKAGIALCYERRGEINSAAKPVAYVHDEIMFSTPVHAGDDTKLWIQKNMEEGMQHFLKTVPVVAEPKLATSWAEK